MQITSSLKTLCPLTFALLVGAGAAHAQSSPPARHRHAAPAAAERAPLQVGRSVSTAPADGAAPPPAASGSYGASLSGRNPAASGLP